eukprot:CAMPEP_0170572482 /NCGR_PEP_ID=MMETSP0224-20130122/2239_1 /TAXON_ID=285029 /ORGANISM="Togula jolla, Strain CCCM 725" /LENGTH=137 /DNA_ID=CAMNT_0010894973 /DNA_START=24 /DNA_END=437 /DNA_ORIENTATION=-
MAQADTAWRRRVSAEVRPLDFPCAQPSQRPSPISWHYAEDGSSRASTASCSRLGSALRPRSSSSSATRNELLSLGSWRSRSRRLGSAGSSSIASQAVRSSVLSLELNQERERREAAEHEIARLKALLTKEGRPSGKV